MAAFLLAGTVPVPARGQFGGGGGFGFGGVGGIAIDAEGIVRNVDGRALESLAAERRRMLGVGDAPARPSPLRKVSLAGLVAAVRESTTKGVPLPPEVVVLGGLERVTHVFVDPDGHDIVLAGPADATRVDAWGNVVAAASGRPILQLEDLVVALRSIEKIREGGIQCSIDPTPEGLVKLRGFLAGQKTIGPNADATLRGMEDALGAQVVTVRGVPAGSRFGSVLVSADYRMKRIGMGLDESHVKGLPSYLSMVPPGGKAGSLPRFWLEPDYGPVARDADELAWRLGDRRMKCLTENDVADRDGAVRRGAAGVDPVAQKWCAAMTDHYDALSAKQPVFADLLGCVDLAVVAALIKGRQLDARAGIDLGPLLDDDVLPLPRYHAPSRVPTVATGIKKGTAWVVSASGGIQFQPWALAANLAEADDVAGARTAALAARASGRAWWWE